MKKITLTLTSCTVAAFMIGCATHERADYERDVHPRTYSSGETITATSDVDAPPRRTDSLSALRVDPDGRVVADRQDEQLKAGPQTQLDQQLAQRIHQTFKDNAEITTEMDDVSIKVIRGRVTLKGWAATEEERQKMESIARQFSGVNFVDNQLKVGTPDLD